MTGSWEDGTRMGNGPVLLSMSRQLPLGEYHGNSREKALDFVQQGAFVIKMPADCRVLLLVDMGLVRLRVSSSGVLCFWFCFI